MADFSFFCNESVLSPLHQICNSQKNRTFVRLIEYEWRIPPNERTL